MIKAFNHTCLIVKDLDRALAFYRDILGLEPVEARVAQGPEVEAILGVKGIKVNYVKLYGPCQKKDTPPILELHCRQNPKIKAEPGYSHICFTAVDLDSEYKRLKEQGVKFISKPTIAPHGFSKIAFCYDPDGNLMELIEEINR